MQYLPSHLLTHRHCFLTFECNCASLSDESLETEPPLLRGSESTKALSKDFLYKIVFQPQGLLTH